MLKLYFSPTASASGGSLVNPIEVTGLDKLTFTQQKPDAMLQNASAAPDSTLTTTVSGELELTGEAFNYIKKYFITASDAPLKILFVNVVDDCCDDTVYNMCITFDGVSWNSFDCFCTVTLKEYMPEFTCFNSTTIADDTYGFQSDANTRQSFPQMDYCKQTDALMIYFAVMFEIISANFTPIIAVVSVIFDIVDGIVSVINDIIDAVNTIPGVDISEINDGKNPLDAHLLSDYLKWRAEIEAEILGCRHYIPSPLVRDYIKNVCQVCGLTFDQSSINPLNNPTSEYYNTVYFSPTAHKGFIQDFDTEDWVAENEPVLTGKDLMDKLKPVFNADYAIKNKTLYFARRDKLVNNSVFNFSKGGADASKLLPPGIQFNWNNQVLPSYDDLGYQSDSLDEIGNNALPRYNDIVEFNSPFNPNKHFSGGRKVTLGFGATRFLNDGIELDPIDGTLTQLFFPTVIISKQFGAVLMKTNETSLPKLIIWDGRSIQHARAKQYPVPTNFSTGGHAGESFTVADPSVQTINCLYNYPFYFRASSNDTQKTLWEFHKIDASNALQFNIKNLAYKLTFNYQCPDLKKCDVFSSVIIPLEDGTNAKGTIDQFEIDFYNRQVTLQGQL